MPNKQDIIDHVEDYDARQIARFIKDGIVSYDELCRERTFSKKVRLEVTKIIAGSEDSDWTEVQRTNTIDGYNTFLKTFPNTPHFQEAQNALAELYWTKVNPSDAESVKDFINRFPNSRLLKSAQELLQRLKSNNFAKYSVSELVEEITAIQTNKKIFDYDDKIIDTIYDHVCIRKDITKDEFLTIIRDDHNFLSSTVIKKIIERNLIEYEDLININIDSRFVKFLTKTTSKVHFDRPPYNLEQINKVPSTEVYFWGIPSSGKSCALGAIMSVANNGKIAYSMTRDNDCQGYGYMNQLASLFTSNGKVGVLPTATFTTSTYEMGFDLEDVSSKGIRSTHPITCVDLAGELVRCMYKSDAGINLAEDELEALSTLTSVLTNNRTKNRKIHFFVLEYGGENRKIEGLDQSVYLAAALRYIERTKIFESDTDAIYLMITKVDKATVSDKMLDTVISAYILENYTGFLHGLEKLCKDFEINGGEVTIVPFSLGEVCFQDYCLFNEEFAANVVRELIDRTKDYKKDKFSSFFNLFKR
jgi:hypothetical protein